MKPFHFIHAVVTLLLLVIVLGFGVLTFSGLIEVRIRSRDAPQATGRLEAQRALLERVSGAVRAGRITRSQQMGTGNEPYQEVPEGGALLVGFEVTYGRFINNPTIKTVRPIFMTLDGKLDGTTHSVPGGSCWSFRQPSPSSLAAVFLRLLKPLNAFRDTFADH
jgi:hypothetical protein